MKRILAIFIAVMMLSLCVPVFAVGADGGIGADDFDPVGLNISNVHAAYITAGGNPSTTDFLTAEDFAAHTITFINVWSNGCGPCINEMPYFQQVHEEYGDHGVLVVGCCSLWISGSYSGEWNWLQNHGYTYMNVIQDDVLYGLYSHNSYVPQTFIVDSEGTVIDFIGGGTTYNNLVNKINQWFAYYSDEYYDVSFVNGVTGEVFEVQSVHAGYTPVYPDPPEVEGYTFNSWDPPTPPAILGPTTITATYLIRTFRVRFYDSITGEKIGNSQFIQYGAAATPPEPPVHEGYTFVGWDGDYTCIHEAIDIYTIYHQGEFLPGDIDGDNNVTVSDALAVLRGAMGLVELTPEQEAAADLNGDGSVNVQDALIILRTAMGLLG